jgi:predicted amidophosphoribosyltransferase
LIYELSVEARRRRRDLNISIRTLAGMLNTSPARVHALLDPTVYRGKTINAMTRLLAALGAEIDVSVRDREALR